MFYAVAYDITDDRRRNAVAKILLDFGTRIQYSLFECNTDKRAYLRLQDRIQECHRSKRRYCDLLSPLPVL